MEFIDLKTQYKKLEKEINANIQNVLNKGNYILGEEVKKLEEELASYVGVKYCATCANGTDALSLALMALDIKEGDAVFVPSFTFYSTSEIVSLEGDIVILFSGHGGGRSLLGALLLVATVGVNATIAVATAVVAAAIGVAALVVAAAVVVVVVGALLVATALGLAAAIAAAEQLHVFGHDADFAALLAGLLVFPYILLQAPLDEHGAALGQVLTGDFCRATPAGYVQVGGFLAALAVVRTTAYAIDSQTQLSHAVAARGGAHFGVGSQVADNHNLV
jgi:hypothetical protein